MSALLLAACSCSTEGTPCTSDDECAVGQSCVDGMCTARSDASSTDAGSGDAGPRPDGGPGSDAGCPIVESSPIAARNPIDVILLVDGTGSTGEVPMYVREQVENNLRVVLEAAGIDYRVILISMCEFDLTGIPSDRYRRFPLVLGSGDPYAYRPLLLNYTNRQWPTEKAIHTTLLEPCVPESERTGPGWSQHLRPGARKVFIHFTDSAGAGQNIQGYDGTFDEELFELDPSAFGTREAPTFTYHAFLGLAGGSDPAFTLYCPSEPIVSGTCTGPFRDPPGPGEGFQGVATRMRGYRAPVCAFDRYDEVFTSIAAGTVAYAQQCEFDLPDTPLGFTLNLDAIAVRYDTTGGATRDFRQVADLASCGEDDFYVDRAADPPRVTLCPQACDLARHGICNTLTADPLGTLIVRFACDPSLI